MLPTVAQSLSGTCRQVNRPGVSNSYPTRIPVGLGPGSDMLRGITAGRPRVLSSLKSLLETGWPFRLVLAARSAGTTLE